MDSQSAQNQANGRSSSLGPPVDTGSNLLVSNEQQDEGENGNEDFECLSQHGVSAHTFNMIKTKERLEGEAKARNQSNLARDSEKREMQEHMRVAEAMRCLFKDQDKQTIFLPIVVESLQDRMHGSFIESNELKRVIGNLMRILPQWCRLVSLPRGNFIRLDGRDRLQIGQIKQAIQAHFEKNTAN